MGTRTASSTGDPEKTGVTEFAVEPGKSGAFPPDPPRNPDPENCKISIFSGYDFYFSPNYRFFPQLILLTFDNFHDQSYIWPI